MIPNLFGAIIAIGLISVIVLPICLAILILFKS